jgi:hypothetical protein
MKRLWLPLCALVACLGCATEADRAQWEEAMKELRGDNMQMSTSGFFKDGATDHSLDPKPRDSKPPSTAD